MEIFFKNIFKDSNLIKNITDENFIINLFHKKINSKKMLYNAKKGNLSGKNFYQNCVDKGSLFFIVKSEKKIFGGFISEGLKSKKKDGIYYQEKKSFLFSLSHRQKLKCININFPIKHCNDSFPKFGKCPDYDLCLNFEKLSHSILGYSFEPLDYYNKNGGGGYQLLGNSGNSDYYNNNGYLAGSRNFFIQEIEVYQIKF